MSENLVFVPSPLVGAETWKGVAAAMADSGHSSVVAELVDDGTGPYWQQHVRSVVGSLPAGARDVVLVAHSGGGPLLAAISHAAGGSVRFLVFVDAGLPQDGMTRLAMLRSEVGVAFAEGFRRHLEAGGRYPEWRDADLAPLVLDHAMRTRILRSQRSRGLDFWTEPIPAPGGWQDLPCAFLRLSKGYSAPCSAASAFGWPVIQRSGGHFDLVTKPGAVARDIEQLLYRLGLATQH